MQVRRGARLGSALLTLLSLTGCIGMVDHEVHLVLRNDTRHALTVTDCTDDWNRCQDEFHYGTLQPGETRTVTVTALYKVYRLSRRPPGHSRYLCIETEDDYDDPGKPLPSVRLSSATSATAVPACDQAQRG